MHTKLIKIGNSKGVRIPKEFLHGFTDDTQFQMKRDGNKLILIPAQPTREKWVEQMMKEAPSVEETFVLNDFDENEWEWK